MMMFQDGRVSKRHQFLLPGGLRMSIKVTTSTVVADIMTDICNNFGLVNDLDKLEFGLFAIIGNSKSSSVSFRFKSIKTKLIRREKLCMKMYDYFEKCESEFR